MLYATADAAGRAGVDLPAEIGTDYDNPPTVVCYLDSGTPTPYWQLISDGYSAAQPYCIVGIGDNGTWFVGMYNAPPGRQAAFVIHY